MTRPEPDPDRDRNRYKSLIDLFPSLQLGTVTLAPVRLSGWLVGGKSCLSVCPSSVRAASRAALSIDRPSVRAGPSCKLGSARRRPRVLGRILRVDLMKPTSMSVRPSVRPQNVSSIRMKFGV